MNQSKSISASARLVILDEHQQQEQIDLKTVAYAAEIFVDKLIVLRSIAPK